MCACVCVCAHACVKPHYLDAVLVDVASIGEISLLALNHLTEDDDLFKEEQSSLFGFLWNPSHHFMDQQCVLNTQRDMTHMSVSTAVRDPVLLKELVVSVTAEPQLFNNLHIPLK